MHKKNTVIFSLLGLLPLIVMYAGMRYWEINRANEAIDAFFAEYRKNQTESINFLFTNQSQADITDILNRNQSAMHNFQYENHTPRLNFRLDRSGVEVSWHLSIIFEKHKGHWYPVLFNDFTPEENKNA